MRILKAATIAVILLLTVSGMCLFLYLRGHGFSTREKPSGIEQFFAVRVRYLAMPSSADAMTNPFAADGQAIMGGAEHFLQQCAICHALDGSGKTDMGVGLYPPPPDLRLRETQRLSDGAIFYIIKNGIRFTGMPAWDMDNDHLWHLVVFIRKLPRLSSDEIDQMAKQSKAAGTHKSTGARPDTSSAKKDDVTH
jgi:mono/diheme cytochrome c family protein